MNKRMKGVSERFCHCSHLPGIVASVLFSAVSMGANRGQDDEWCRGLRCWLTCLDCACSGCCEAFFHKRGWCSKADISMYYIKKKVCLAGQFCHASPQPFSWLYFEINLENSCIIFEGLTQRNMWQCEENFQTLHERKAHFILHQFEIKLCPNILCGNHNHLNPHYFSSSFF